MRIGKTTIDEKEMAVAERDGQWYKIGNGYLVDATVWGGIPLREFGTVFDALTADAMPISQPDHFLLTHEPGQIICVGRNYAAHAEELGNEVPTNPILFNKLPSTCIADGETIEFPESLGRVDYEGEIGVVIGKDTWQVARDDAYDAILGYTLLNDVTARDQQSQAKSKGHPWLMAKNHRTFCPFGPTITLKESLPWPLNLDIELKVDGQTRQSGNTSQFLFDIPTLIAHISAQIPLRAGDIIATGTPEGVSPLEDAQTVEVTAPGLGTLRSTVYVSHKVSQD